MQIIRSMTTSAMKLDRLHIEKTTFAAADAANGWQTWRHRTPRERLEALESLRMLRIRPLPDGSLPRLQRLHIVIERRARWRLRGRVAWLSTLQGRH